MPASKAPASRAPARNAPPASRAEAAALAIDYADRLVLRTVRDVHRAIGARSLGLVGTAALPVRQVHDGVSGGVYGVIGAGVRAAGAALRVLDRTGGRGEELEARPGGRRVAAVVNGLVGEALNEARHPMAIRLAARRAGHDIDDGDVEDGADLAAAYPDASGDVAVFVHGLCEDEECWDAGGYPQLAAELGWTPVLIRYNSGLRIEHNGEQLSQWLDRLLERWPVPVRRIALVGHSMGGLVALAGCRAGGAAAWPARVHTVVCLGTPHLGAPLEQAVHHGSRALAAFAESAPFARILDTRSAGIVDLGRGSPGCDPLPTATYHCVSASVGGPLGHVVGDLLVRRGSATGRIPGATTRHLPRTHHFGLLNHPDVCADLRRLLTQS